VIRLIADVINMFRLEGVCENKIPPAPPFLKGGNAYTQASLIVAIGMLNLLQAFISSSFDTRSAGACAA
jgi:hypothetical protein